MDALLAPRITPASQVNVQRLSTPSDEELLARARDGDHRAFRVLVERYEGQVVAVVTGMLGDTSEVNDVAQETFIQFYEALGQFRGEARVKTYLTRIALNRSLDALRRRKRWLRRFVSQDDQPAAAVARESWDRSAERADPLRTELVHRALQALPSKHRAVVVLRMVEGYTTQETAELLGIAYGTVLSRLSRAQDKLRALLAPWLQDPSGAPAGPLQEPSERP